MNEEIIKNIKLLTFDGVYVTPKFDVQPDLPAAAEVLNEISNYSSSKFHLKIEEKFRSTNLKVFVQYVNYNYLLTNLLRTKNESIFAENEKLPVIFKIPKDIIYIGDNLIINHQTQPHESNYFAAIIDFLLSQSDRLLLDAKMCARLKIEIEREIEKEKTMNFFAVL